MFDLVREKRRLVQIVLALIIVPFALWGVDSYRKSGGATPLATVNGIKIGQQEFDNALQQQQDRIREMAGPNFDPAFFDNPEIKRSILDGLVTQHLLGEEARRIGLSLTDEQIAQVIASIGAFQIDGKFNKKRYEEVLSQKGMNRFGFESRVHQDLLIRQLTDAYTQNGYASDTVAANLIRLNEQQRKVAVASLAAAAFMNQVKLPDNAISDYYKNNEQEFQIPERAKVEYVVFSVDSLLSQVAVSDDEIKQYYKDHQAEFGTQEQRQAAHILISVDKQASDVEKQAARAKAEQVLNLVRQSPAKFAALAKQYSQDPGSAADGGDIGFFGHGAMVKPFEDSAFSLKVGELSGLVRSDFGYHIIKLLAVKPTKIQALSKVKNMIRERLKLQHASDKFAELAENFSNTVYEQSDSLEPAAKLVNMPIKRGVWLSKGQVPAGLWTDKVLQAIFSEDALQNKRNIEAVEVVPNTMLSAHVTEFKPASVRPLSEVSVMIQQKLKKQQAINIAIQQGEKTLEQLQRGEKVKIKWKTAQNITRNQRSDIEPGLLQAIFRADGDKLPAYAGASSQNGYTLARIDAVKYPAQSDEGNIGRYKQQMRQITGEAMLTAYLADLRKNADITMKDFAEDSN